LENKIKNSSEISNKKSSLLISSSNVNNSKNCVKSFENTPNSLWTGSNAIFKERSLSALTDESLEPCNFMDYYKAYKKENGIPPSVKNKKKFSILFII
jgi:hypothetical protein